MQNESSQKIKIVWRKETVRMLIVEIDSDYGTGWDVPCDLSVTGMNYDTVNQVGDMISQA